MDGRTGMKGGKVLFDRNVLAMRTVKLLDNTLLACEACTKAKKLTSYLRTFSLILFFTFLRINGHNPCSLSGETATYASRRAVAARAACDSCIKTA